MGRRYVEDRQVSFQDPAHCREALRCRIIDTGEESANGRKDSMESACRELKLVSGVGLNNDTPSKFRPDTCKTITEPSRCNIKLEVRWRAWKEKPYFLTFANRFGQTPPSNIWIKSI
jgi:hypothetical protein